MNSSDESLPCIDPLRIALAQIAPRLGDVEHNLQQHLDIIAQARDQNADLVVFPELSLTGYFLRDMVPDVALEPGAVATPVTISRPPGRASTEPNVTPGGSLVNRVSKAPCQSI